MKADDRFFLPCLQPEIAGNPTVVFVDATIALLPVIELAGAHPQPRNEPPYASFGLLRPAPDEIQYRSGPACHAAPSRQLKFPKTFF